MLFRNYDSDILGPDREVDFEWNFQLKCKASQSTISKYVNISMEKKNIIDTAPVREFIYNINADHMLMVIDHINDLHKGSRITVAS